MLIGGQLFSFPNITLVTQDKEKALMSTKQVFLAGNVQAAIPHPNVLFMTVISLLCEQKSVLKLF